jgi:predicted nuclease with TOPRIM domain
MPAPLPPCMMPDGGECCPQYHDLKKEVSALRNLLEAVREDNQRLQVLLSEKRTQNSDYDTDELLELIDELRAENTQLRLRLDRLELRDPADLV